MLQKCIILLLSAFSCTVCLAANKNSFKDSTTIIIALDIAPDQHVSVDSIYLVFDRCDHSGAGVVKQIFYPVSNKVTVTVPKGKYYVSIVCLGMYNRESFDRKINAKANKENKVLLKLSEPPLFVPGFAYIPEEKIDFSNLLVTRDSFYK